jgi:hypothetical protein
MNQSEFIAKAREWTAKGATCPIVPARIEASIELKRRKIMPRFTIGARVRVAEENTTDRVGTVVEVLPGTQRAENYARYRVEFSDGSVEVLSDLQLSPAGSGPTVPSEP